MIAVQHGTLGPARLRDYLTFDANAVQASFMDNDRAFLQARASFIEQTTELLYDLQVAQEVGQRKWPHLMPFEIKWARMLAFEISRGAVLVGANRLATHCRKLRDHPDTGAPDLQKWATDALVLLQRFVLESETYTVRSGARRSPLRAAGSFLGAVLQPHKATAMSFLSADAVPRSA
jgi:hypothetical protein